MRNFRLLPVFALSLLAVPAFAAGPTHTVDAVHSSVLFKVLHLGASYNWGRFNDFSGTISLDAAKPENSSVEFTIKTASVDTNNSKRDDHLRGPDFFLAKQFPAATFKSKTVKKTGEKTWDISGDLTIRGVTKPASFTFNHVGTGKNQAGKEILGGETSFKFKRSDFGVSYGIPNIGDEVELVISMEAIQN